MNLEKQKITIELLTNFDKRSDLVKFVKQFISTYKLENKFLSVKVKDIK